jgi:hypothetical protein
MSSEPATGHTPVSRAHIGRPSGRLPVAHQHQLAATLGVALRALRDDFGLSSRQLARRAGVARSTITRLEAGQRRPRRSLLSVVAWGLCPDAAAAIGAVLIAAAGAHLADESPWSPRTRWRRLHRALMSKAAPLPGALRQRAADHIAADMAWHQATTILDRPGVVNDAAALAECRHLMDRATQLRAAAGPPFSLRIGRHTTSYGLHA